MSADSPRYDLSSIPDADPASPAAVEATTIVRVMLAAEEAGTVVWSERARDWRERPKPYTGPPREVHPISTEALLGRLERVRPTSRGWSALCPSHEDRSPSLSIRRGDRWWLLWCHAGCATEDVIAALGLEWGELALD